MKKMAVIFSTLGAIALILCILFTVLQIVANDDTVINNEFTTLSISKGMGMTNSDLVLSTTNLVDYMEGTRESIATTVTINGEKQEMFPLQEEIDRMEYVRSLWQQGKQYRQVGIFAALACFLLAAMLDFRASLHTMAVGYCSGLFVSGMVLGFFGSWGIMDFSSFWKFVYDSIFWESLTTFDSVNSRMVQMLPDQFFSDILGRFGGYSAIVLLVLLGLSVFAIVAHNRRLRREEEAAERAAAEKAAARKKKKAAAAKAAVEQENPERPRKKKTAERTDAVQTSDTDAPPRKKKAATDADKTEAADEQNMAVKKKKADADGERRKKQTDAKRVRDDRSTKDAAHKKRRPVAEEAPAKKKKRPVSPEVLERRAAQKAKQTLEASQLGKADTLLENEEEELTFAQMYARTMDQTGEIRRVTPAQPPQEQAVETEHYTKRAAENQRLAQDEEEAGFDLFGDD